MFQTFDITNPDLIDHDLNNLDNNFEYSFLTSYLLIYDVDQRRINNLSAIIDTGQQCEDLPNDSISISSNLLAKIAIQDIVNIDSARVTETPFNTSFNIENIVNFYIIGSSFHLTYHHFEERKDLTIKDNISQS